MRTADVYVDGVKAARLEEREKNKHYVLRYDDGYLGQPVSLTMPVKEQMHEFDRFPPFFDGLLPEGPQLEALLRIRKLDATDYFGQLAAVGEDLVGNVTVKAVE